MNRIGVMQVTDTLAMGGLERVAVNLANCLDPQQFRSHLCSTRAEGPLANLIGPQVECLFLKRTGRLDFKAVRALVREIRARDIRIVHAHGTSLFISALAGWLSPKTRLVWHDHFGRSGTEERPAWIYRIAAKRANAVIAVNETLAQWSRERLRVPERRVWYVPNFICESAGQASVDLPGQPGYRIVCVANLRPEKDHLNLICAMNLVAREIPQAHLILVGAASDQAYRERIEKAIAREKAHVTWLGPRNDVAAILKACDLGVLGSASEGLPLALLEYGMAGLPVVSTSVGQCPEVLEQGRLGALVPPFDAAALARAIVTMLNSPNQRQELSRRFGERVRQTHSAGAVMGRICEIYKTVLESGL